MKDIAHIVACLERIPCQQMMAVEDCDVVVATHVLHRDRYERLPRSEWCDRCDALASARELLVPADSQPEASGEAGTVTRPAGSEEPTT